MAMLLLVLVLTVGASPAPVAEVTVAPDRITIKTPGAALREVLDLVGERTGMKVIYDGPPPQQKVKVEVDEDFNLPEATSQQGAVLPER